MNSAILQLFFKKKGARNDFKNYRGIFGTSVFRYILDRLIYNDMYNKIDQNMTDANVGCRKWRNVRDNIFVINAITNSVIKSKKDSVDYQIFDVETCFDKLNLEECISDLYDIGLNNDKLALLYLENKNCKVAVKTTSGLTRRININNIVLQGTLWSGLLCSAQMDKLSQNAYKNHSTYLYKGKTEVPPLEMVDDILFPTSCNNDSIIANVKVNNFMERKKLTLNSKKCNKMHIGKTNKNCSNLNVHSEKMKTSTQEKYLGDILTNDGKLTKTIE